MAVLISGVNAFGMENALSISSAGNKPVFDADLAPITQEKVLGPQASQAMELFKMSPALFVENRGQWADQSVRFVHNGSGMNVAMTDAGPVFQAFRREHNKPEQPDALTPGVRFSASFVGAKRVAPIGRQRSSTVFNYSIGDPSTRREQVPSYEIVAYEGLYDGINLLTWGLRSSLKYEFHVAPGADWRQIAVRYDGIGGLSIAGDGSLVVDMGDQWGVLVDDAPYIYQEIDGKRLEVAGKFVLLDKHTYAFEITGKYDPERELIIDPDLIWSTYLGGSGDDRGHSIAVDSSGNIVVTGETSSSGWISGGYDTSLGGSTDCFVTKLSPSGEHLWSTYVGGSGWDSGYGVAVDSSGNVLVTGETYSSGWVSDGYDTSYGGNRDGFVVKLSPSGGHLWSTYLGGSGWDWGEGIAVDSSDNILVTGETYSASWVSGGYDTSLSGDSDGFAVKLNPSGGHLWSSYLGGDSSDWGYGIAADSSGNILVTGLTKSSNWVSGGYDTSYNGDLDAFVAKLSPSGSHIWSTYLGGSGWDWGYGIAVDSSGSILVTGLTRSANWVSGGYDTSLGGDTDAFVAKLSTLGAHVWSTYLGGSNSDYGRDIAVDSSGSILVTGLTRSANWVSGGYDTGLGGDSDAFVAKLNTAGTHVWSTYLGGSNDEDGRGIALDSSGNVLVTGITLSSGWISGGYDTSHNGSADAFAVKLASSIFPETVATPTFSVNGGIYDHPQNVVVSCSTPGAVLRYTTNGLDPTLDDPAIESGTSLLISVDPPTTLKAKAWKTGFNASQVKSAVYRTRSNEITIGTGTSLWNYPLSTYYHDARTQTIYLASEIGGAFTINALSLDVATVPGQTMNEFTVRMKHTPLNDYQQSMWESAGWTVVYQANETIASTGWWKLAFSTPFEYNGTDNLMVDISFNNSSYTSDGYCRYSIPGGNRSLYYKADSVYNSPLDWAGVTPQPSVNNYVPNIKLSIQEIVEPVPATIPEAKLAADDTLIRIEAAIVSAAWDDVFYISSDNRSAGVRVERKSHGLTEGMRATVTGYPRTSLNGERYIEASSAVQAGSGSVKPLGMPNKSLGGGDFLNPATATGQAGVVDGIGLNNIGLLVRTMGVVTSVGSGFLYIDDGSELKDGSSTNGKENTGLRVVCDSSGYKSGDYLVVTGISASVLVGEAPAKCLLTRSPEDIHRIRESEVPDDPSV